MIVPSGPIRDVTTARLNPLANRAPQETVSAPAQVRSRISKYGRMSNVLTLDFPQPTGWTIKTAMSEMKRKLRDYWADRPGLIPREIIQSGSMKILSQLPNGEVIKYAMSMPAGQVVVNPLDLSTLTKSLDILEQNFEAKWADVQLRGSGHSIVGVITAQVVVNAGYQSLAEAAYRGAAWVELPRELQAKHSVLNIKNDDSRCFQWCIIAHEMLEGGWHPDPKHADRVSFLQQTPVQAGRYSKRRRLNPEPIDVGLDFSMFPQDDWRTVDIQKTAACARRKSYNTGDLADASAERSASCCIWSTSVLCGASTDS